jgi:hypothetical protein
MSFLGKISILETQDLCWVLMWFTREEKNGKPRIYGKVSVVWIVLIIQNEGKNQEFWKSACKAYQNIKSIQWHFWQWHPHDWWCWVDNRRQCPYRNGILANHSIFWLTVHFLHDSIHRLYTYTNSLVCCLSYLSLSVVSNYKGLDLHAQKWNTTHV